MATTRYLNCFKICCSSRTFLPFLWRRCLRGDLQRELSVQTSVWGKSYLTKEFFSCGCRICMFAGMESVTSQPIVHCGSLLYNYLKGGTFVWKYNLCSWKLSKNGNRLVQSWAQFCCKMWGDRLVWNQYIRKPKEKMWGDRHIYIPTVWKSGGSASTVSPT